MSKDVFYCVFEGQNDVNKGYWMFVGESGRDRFLDPRGRNLTFTRGPGGRQPLRKPEGEGGVGKKFRFWPQSPTKNHPGGPYIG